MCCTGWREFFNRSAEIGMGGTGYQPDGMKGAWSGTGGTNSEECPLPFRAAGSRAAQAGCLCYPLLREAAPQIRSLRRISATASCVNGTRKANAAPK